jgi:hypothetical protein
MGLVVAALTAWKLTDRRAIAMAVPPPMARIH